MNELKKLEESRKHASDCLDKQLDRMMDFYKKRYGRYLLPECIELMELCVKKLKHLGDHRNFEPEECTRILCTIDSLLYGYLEKDVLQKFIETLTLMIVNLNHMDEQLQEKAVEVTRGHMDKSVKMVCENLKDGKDSLH